MHVDAATGGTAGTVQPHILVVDDDAQIAGVVARYLGTHGCRTRIAGSGERLRGVLARHRVDLVLLDLGLPDEDGLQLLRYLQSELHIPVIVVSGRGESVERVVGLELGADDYVVKPFDLRELLARVRSVLRRSDHQREHTPPASEAVLQFDGLRLDPVARRLLDRDGREIALTRGEFDLLQALLARPNQVLTRDELMNRIHGRDAGPYDRAIDVQVGRLRRKIELDAVNPRLIQAVRGAGYVLAAVVERA